MCGEKDRTGFTLLEVLVALAVFSLAALALLRVQGVSLTGLGRLDERVLATIEVENLAVAARLTVPAPAYGESRGETVNGGRRWLWRQMVERTPDAGLQRITIELMSESGQKLAEVLVVRAAS